MGDATKSAAVLAFAIAHEVGNHLGGIRLQAHLLDEELDARSLAEASILIDDLAARSGPLLTLLRPLLLDDWQRSGGERWAELISRVWQQVEEEGTRGTRFEVVGEVDPGLASPDCDWIHPLLIALIGTTVVHAGRSGSVALSFTANAGEEVLSLEDDGPEEVLDSDAALRGRPLVVALARELVGRAGGRVDAVRTDGRTRVDLVWPKAG